MPETRAKRARRTSDHIRTAYLTGATCFHPEGVADRAVEQITAQPSRYLEGVELDAFQALMPATWQAQFRRGWAEAGTGTVTP